MTNYPAVEDFVNDLLPDDVGHEEVGGYIVYFEGFTHVCWADAEEKGRTVDSLTVEILKDWSDRNGGLTLLEHGWTEEPVPFEDTVFFAIYQKAG